MEGLRDSIIAYHYSDRAKAMIILVSGLLECYSSLSEEKRSASLNLMLKALESLITDVNMAVNVLRKRVMWAIEHLADASDVIAKATDYVELGDYERAERALADAVSHVSTCATKAFSRLEEAGVSL